MSIAILCGGNSSEHEISIISALTIYNKYKDFKFLYLDKSNNLFLIKKPTTDNIINKKGRKVYFKNSKVYNTDIDFIILINHGYLIEDRISGILDFYNIRYLGSGLYSSIISMDKWLTYLLLKYNNIIQVDKQLYNENISIDYPVILKPARCGSSLGIHICNNKEELEYFKYDSLKYDNKLIIEKYLEDKDEYCTAFYFDGKDIIMSKVEKNEYDNDIFDFDNKYLTNNKGFNHHFISDDNIVNNIYEIGSKVYKILECKDIVRIDFFIKDNIIYLNEVNTLPGSLSYFLFDDFDKVLNTLIDRHLNEFKVNNLEVNKDILKYNNKLK